MPPLPAVPQRRAPILSGLGVLLFTLGATIATAEPAVAPEARLVENRRLRIEVLRSCTASWSGEPKARFLLEPGIRYVPPPRVIPSRFELVWRDESDEGIRSWSVSELLLQVTERLNPGIVDDWSADILHSPLPEDLRRRFWNFLGEEFHPAAPTPIEKLGVAFVGLPMPTASTSRTPPLTRTGGTEEGTHNAIELTTPLSRIFPTTHFQHAADKALFHWPEDLPRTTEDTCLSVHTIRVPYDCSFLIEARERDWSFRLRPPAPSPSSTRSFYGWLTVCFPADISPLPGEVVTIELMASSQEEAALALVSEVKVHYLRRLPKGDRSGDYLR